MRIRPIKTSNMATDLYINSTISSTGHSIVHSLVLLPYCSYFAPNMADFTEISRVLSWSVARSLNHNWSIDGLSETVKLDSPFRSFSPLFVESRPWPISRPRPNFSTSTARTTATNTPKSWTTSSLSNVSSDDEQMIDKIALFLAKREVYGRG